MCDYFARYFFYSYYSLHDFSLNDFDDDLETEIEKPQSPLKEKLPILFKGCSSTTLPNAIDKSKVPTRVSSSKSLVNSNEKLEDAKFFNLNAEQKEKYEEIKNLVKINRVGDIEEVNLLMCLKAKQYIKIIHRFNVKEALKIAISGKKFREELQPSKIRVENIKNEYNTGVI